MPRGFLVKRHDLVDGRPPSESTEDDPLDLTRRSVPVVPDPTSQLFAPLVAQVKSSEPKRRVLSAKVWRPALPDEASEPCKSPVERKFSAADEAICSAAEEAAQRSVSVLSNLEVALRWYNQQQQQRRAPAVLYPSLHANLQHLYPHYASLLVPQLLPPLPPVPPPAMRCPSPISPLLPSPSPTSQEEDDEEGLDLSVKSAPVPAPTAAAEPLTPPVSQGKKRTAAADSAPSSKKAKSLATSAAATPSPSKKHKAARRLAFDDELISPVSGTLIRPSSASDAAPGEDGMVVRPGDIDPAFNVVEVTEEARQELAKIENRIGDYLCRLCRVVFEDAFGLAQHRCPRIVHVEYRCPECDKVFNCPANLASHRRWHKPRPNQSAAAKPSASNNNNINAKKEKNWNAEAAAQFHPTVRAALPHCESQDKAPLGGRYLPPAYSSLHGPHSPRSAYGAPVGSFLHPPTTSPVVAPASASLDLSAQKKTPMHVQLLQIPQVRAAT